MRGTEASWRYSWSLTSNHVLRIVFNEPSVSLVRDPTVGQELSHAAGVRQAVPLSSTLFVSLPRFLLSFSSTTTERPSMAPTYGNLTNQDEEERVGLTSHAAQQGDNRRTMHSVSKDGYGQPARVGKLFSSSFSLVLTFATDNSCTTVSQALLPLHPNSPNTPTVKTRSTSPFPHSNPLPQSPPLSNPNSNEPSPSTA